MHNYWRIYPVLISSIRGFIVAGCDHRFIYRRYGIFVIIYEGESTENLKSAIKIRATARLSCKFQQWYLWIEEWPTGGSAIHSFIH